MALSKMARAKIPESKFAGPHDSYPVDTPKHLKAAKALAGMHHAPAAVKAKIGRLGAHLGEPPSPPRPKPMHIRTSVPRSDSHIMAPHMPSFHTKARQY